MKSRARHTVLILLLGMFLLAGCGTKGKESKLTSADTLPEQGEAIYLGMIDDRHIRVYIDDVRKMVEIPEELLSTFQSFPLEERFTFTYKKNAHNAYIIHSVVKGPEVKKEKEVKKKEKEEKEEKKKEKTPIYQSDLGYEVTLPKGVTAKSENDGDMFVYEDHPHYVATVTQLPKEREIVKERWRAAGLLKENGALKELFAENIPHKAFIASEFVFTSSGKSVAMYVVVKEIDGHLLRISVTVPHDIKDNGIWEMLAGIAF